MTVSGEPRRTGVRPPRASGGFRAVAGHDDLQARHRRERCDVARTVMGHA
jgi:hypothetical protein